MRGRRSLVAALLAAPVAALLVAGCGSSAARVTARASPTATSTPIPTATSLPTPTSPPPPPMCGTPNAFFSGRLLVVVGSDLHQLTCGSAPDTLQDAVLASGSDFSLAVDGKSVRYRTADAVVLRSLADGVEQRFLVGTTVDCATWSPDSSRLSYVSSGGLYVYTLWSGATDQITQEPSGDYAPIGGGQTSTYYGHITRAAWLSADAFLFDRFVGPMPSSVSVPGTPELAANTTTLHRLTDGSDTDIPKPEFDWVVDDVAADGSYVLLDGPILPNHYSAQYYLLQPNQTLADARMISCAGYCTVFGFVPGSHLLYMSDDGRELALLDPATLQETTPFPILDYINQRDNITWIGGPDSRTFADHDYYTTVNLRDQAHYGFGQWLVPNPDPATVVRLLGWLP